MASSRIERPPARPWSGSPSRQRVLRWALLADAALTVANAVAYLVAADALDSLLRLPSALLRGVGAFLAAYALIVWFIATRPAPPPLAVRAVAAGNSLWAVASVILAAAGWFTPSDTGTAWIVLQAATVAGFALVQWRCRPAAHR